MLATLPAVAAAGFDVVVAAPGGGPLSDSLREVGVSCRAFDTRDEAGVRMPLPRIRAELAVLLGRERPAIVHANSLSMARISGPVAAECDVSSVGHLRDILNLSRRAVDNLNAHRRLVAVSGATRDFHVAQGLSASKCVVAYNGVDLARFYPRPRSGYLQRELGLSAASRFVVTIGQIGLRKGIDVAMAAMARVLAEVPDAHWLIVGERTSAKSESREFEEAIRAAANRPPCVGRVHWLGTRSDVDTLLNECALLLHAARQEPLGRVLLESAASGLPVVATDAGGTREIFPHDADGAILASVDDAAALAEAAVALLQDEQCRTNLAAGGRQRVEQQFDIRRAAARLIEIYDELLS